jgi:ribosomal protein S18 acetylase RimI-like enzyme
MIKIRVLSERDIEDIIRVENDSWESEVRADKETFLKRLMRYPRGFIGGFVDDRLAGMVYGHPINDVKKTWHENSSEEAFDSNGGIYYLVNVGISKNYQNTGLGSKLLDETKKIAREMGFKRIVLGARNIESNVNFYRKNGFSKIEEVENYLPDDKESLGKGVIMEYLMSD